MSLTDAKLVATVNHQGVPLILALQPNPANDQDLQVVYQVMIAETSWSDPAVLAFPNGAADPSVAAWLEERPAFAAAVDYLYDTRFLPAQGCPIR